MKNIRAYHSCFIVDVKISSEGIKLEDSFRCHYYVDINDKEAVASFQKWFQETFLKSVAQTVTVFSYETKRVEEGISGAFIKKFISSTVQKSIEGEVVEPIF